MKEISQSECRQCGTCCQKSSPTLHPEDAELFRRETLSLADVYILRRGEFVFDNISGRLARLDEELVKVNERPGSRICQYFDAERSICRIYEVRPLQCRTLECWNPDPLLELFGSRKLRRLDLVRDSQVRDLIQHHDARASFIKLAEHFNALADGGPEEPILDILNFDLYIRDLVVEHSVLDPSTLPFHFGRPMVECLSGFGYRLEGDKDTGLVLVASS